MNKLGIIGPSPEDKRDFIHRMPALDGMEVKPVDFRDFFPLKNRDQKTTNACGGYAASYALEVISKRMITSLLPDYKDRLYTEFSANDLYWSARLDTSSDNGVLMRNLLKGMRKVGAPHIKTWRDNESVFRGPIKKNVPRMQIPEYERIELYSTDEAIENIKRTLSIQKMFILIGASIADKNNTHATLNRGRFTNVIEKDFIWGGHAMLAIGWMYYNGEVYLILMNSWGQRIGDKGFFYIPLKNWLENNYLFDFFTVDPKHYFIPRDLQ